MSKILVLNSGSSSLKFQLFEEEKVLVKGMADAIGLPNCEFRYAIGDGNEVTSKIKIKDHIEAVSSAIDAVTKVCPRYEISAIGHRVVHGGEKYSEWRGLGQIPSSGLEVRNNKLNAKIKYSKILKNVLPAKKTDCRCGDVIKGLIDPVSCKLYKKVCTPNNPVGACMVSEEGSCAIYYRYDL